MKMPLKRALRADIEKKFTRKPPFCPSGIACIIDFVLEMNETPKIDSICKYIDDRAVDEKLEDRINEKNEKKLGEKQVAFIKGILKYILIEKRANNSVPAHKKDTFDN